MVKRFVTRSDQNIDAAPFVFSLALDCAEGSTVLKEVLQCFLQLCYVGVCVHGMHLLTDEPQSENRMAHIC